VIRIFLADDHDIVRQGLRQVLEETGQFEVVGDATDGWQVLHSEALAGADVLLLDLSLPKLQGAEVLRRVRVQWPHVKVAIFSMYPAEQFERPLLAAGASLYLSKSMRTSEIVSSLEELVMGKIQEPDPTPDLAPHEMLSPREHQVMMRYVTGHSVVEIAAELNLNPSTVSNHLAQIRRKLRVRTNVDIVHYAHRAGLVEFPDSL
jgi:DNA-binding NarL/FixJ family response regulator